MPSSMILLPVDLDEIVKEVVDFVGNGQEIPDGDNTDHFVVFIDNGELPDLMLHHHVALYQPYRCLHSP